MILLLKEIKGNNCIIHLNIYLHRDSLIYNKLRKLQGLRDKLFSKNAIFFDKMSKASLFRELSYFN